MGTWDEAVAVERNLKEVNKGFGFTVDDIDRTTQAATIAVQGFDFDSTANIDAAIQANRADKKRAALKAETDKKRAALKAEIENLDPLDMDTRCRAAGIECEGVSRET